MKNLLQILLLINLLGSLGCMKDLPPCTKPTIEIKATKVDEKCLNDCQVRFFVQAKLDDKVIALKESELKYKWTFVENGVPKDSFNKTLTLRFNEVGIYTISVKVWDESKTVYCKEMEFTYKYQAIRESLADFDFEPNNTVYNLDQCPQSINIRIIDKSENAEYHKWTFSNGKGLTIPFMNPENLYFPSKYFSSPDTVTVTLEISKNVAPKTKTIYLNPYKYESGELKYVRLPDDSPVQSLDLVIPSPKDTFYMFHFWTHQLTQNTLLSYSRTSAARTIPFQNPGGATNLYRNSTDSRTTMYGVKNYVAFLSKYIPDRYYNVINVETVRIGGRKISAISIMFPNNGVIYDPNGSNFPPLNVTFDTIDWEENLYTKARGMEEINNREVVIYGSLIDPRNNDERTNQNGVFLTKFKIDEVTKTLNHRERQKFLFFVANSKLIDIKQVCKVGNAYKGFGLKREAGIIKACLFNIDVGTNITIDEVHDTPLLSANFEVIKMFDYNGKIILIGNDNNNGIIYKEGSNPIQRTGFIFKNAYQTSDNKVVCIGKTPRGAGSITVSLDKLEFGNDVLYYAGATASGISPVNTANLSCGFVIAGYFENSTKLFYVCTDSWGRIN